MYVMSPKEAKKWLNRPEQEGIKSICCYRDLAPCTLVYEDGKRHTSWFAVNTLHNIYRKKPWHWPKPDGNTPIDAKVWTKRDNRYNWEKRYMSKAGYVFINGTTSWSSNGIDCKKEIIVLANPDNLDEVPPMDLEV